MSVALAEAKVAVIGGDLRQVAVAEAMAKKAACVCTYGLPKSPAEIPITSAACVQEALHGAAAVILPIGGIGADGRVSSLPEQSVVYLDAGFWRSLPQDTLTLVGSLAPDIRNLAAAAGQHVVEYAEIDEIAILNSIPTAEGALQLAMETLPITVHGCCCLILGMGRVGITTARLFQAVGAQTWVAANRPALRARAHEMGCRTLSFRELAAEIGRADIVINTVPALVLTERLLAITRPSVYIIDLASAPGGVDFEAAKALNRKSVLALGLPGKVAPETAGQILSSTLLALIERELT